MSTKSKKAVVPGSIRKLLAAERPLYLAHLLRLDNEARRKRFGHTVNDEFVRRFANTARAPDCVLFGYFEAGQLRGVGELRLLKNQKERSAEAAFSVERDYAGHGVATALMERILRSARNRRLKHVVINFMPENDKMRTIAAHFGAEMHFAPDNITGDILPGTPDVFSYAGEAFDDRMGLVLSVLDFNDRLAPGQAAQ